MVDLEVGDEKEAVAESNEDGESSKDGGGVKRATKVAVGQVKTGATNL